MLLFFIKNNRLTKKMSYEFIGWVPCVSGKLYFEFTSCDVINDKGYLNTNHIELDRSANEEKRYFIVASEVDWEDVKTTTSEGIWNVILIGSAPLNSSEIVGNVFLIPSSNNIWRERIVPHFLEISQLVKDKDDIRIKHSELEQLLIGVIESNGVFGANFLLKDNGITYLNSLKTGLDKDDALLICRQCYYFVKYTFHKDKHHARSETLTTCHRLVSANDAGLVLVSDLKKALVTLKRDCDAADYKSLFAAKGILSYAKSLLMTCKAEALIQDERYVIEKAYVDNMGESLDVMGKRIEGELVTKTSFDNNCRSIGLLILAAVAPFTLVYRDQIGAAIQNTTSAKDIHIVRGVVWLVGNESHVLMVLALVFAVYWIVLKICLKYGSTVFAARKLKRASVVWIDMIVNNQRSAEIMYQIAVACLFLLAAYIMCNFFY